MRSFAALRMTCFILVSSLAVGGCASIANKDDIYLLKTETNEEMSALKLNVQRLEEQVQELSRELDYVKKDTTNQLSNLSADLSSRLATVEQARTKDKEEISKKFSVVLDEVAGPRGTSSRTPPARRTPVEIPPGALTYRVRTGDTISKIARQYGISAQDLMAANGIEDSNTISIGENLVIPGAPSESTEPAAE